MGKLNNFPKINVDPQIVSVERRIVVFCRRKNDNTASQNNRTGHYNTCPAECTLETSYVTY